MHFSHAESRNLQNCCLTCHFQINVISKRIKLETWDCAQMKGLSSSYWLVISYDLLHGYLGRQIWKTMGCVFFFDSRSKKDVGFFTCKHILFLHAFLSCDTTSRIFGIGKSTILKKFKLSTALQQAANVFDSPISTHEEIASAGEKVFVALYNGKANDSLNTLRFSKYCEKVAKNLNKVEPRSLPPTSAAAKFHSYRVFLQICQWKNQQCDLQAD